VHRANDDHTPCRGLCCQHNRRAGRYDRRDHAPPVGRQRDIKESLRGQTFTSRLSCVSGARLLQAQVTAGKPPVQTVQAVQTLRPFLAQEIEDLEAARCDL
jgi:hypothetical protein